MFDVGFSELIVIGIVALVVIGPERLPKVARTVGHLLGRMQRYVNDVKADINREMQLDELKTLRDELHDSARTFERSLTSELQAVEHLVEQTAHSAQATVGDPAAAAPVAALPAAETVTVAGTAPADPAALPPAAKG